MVSGVPTFDLSLSLGQEFVRVHVGAQLGIGKVCCDSSYLLFITDQDFNRMSWFLRNLWYVLQQEKVI